MLGYKSHNVPPGTWSDDTSMTIATIDSIIEKETIDYKNIMGKFLIWYTLDKYTATGITFDIGNTCAQALRNFSEGAKEPLLCGQKDFQSNGNGSLMRMLPIAFFCYYKKLNKEEIMNIVNNISSLTHAHEISKLGCYIYANYIINLLKGNDKYLSYEKIKQLDYSSYKKETIKAYKRLLTTNIQDLSLNEIKSSGYVIDTLEACLWVILNTNNFSQAIIGAINLGEDTDTIGAITGSIAGILYGLNSIPSKWLNELKRINYLTDLAKKYETYLSMNY